MLRHLPTVGLLVAAGLAVVAGCGDRRGDPRGSLASPSAGCAPGYADASFGVGGWASVPVGDRAELAIELRDGRIAVLVVSGDRHDSYQLALLTPAGIAVPGVAPVRVRSSAGPLVDIEQAIVDGRDRLLMATSVALAMARAPAFTRPALLRRKADGRPDATFGRNGTVTLGRAHGIRYGAFHAVTVLADGRVVAAGTANGRLLIARFSSRGRLDPTFGTRGVRIVSPGTRSRYDTATAISVLPDRSLLVSGEGRTFGEPADDVRIVLARVARNGDRVDEAVGRTDLSTNGRVFGQIMRPGGAWIIGDSKDERFVLARITRHGRFDARVGRRGVVTHALPRPRNAGDVAGGAPFAGGGVFVAGNSTADVDIRFADGEVYNEARETPVLAAFDSEGLRVRSTCSPTPVRPPGVWGAELASVAPVDGGLIAAGWTRPQPTKQEIDAFTEGRWPTSPVVFRALVHPSRP